MDSLRWCAAVFFLSKIYFKKNEIKLIHVLKQCWLHVLIFDASDIIYSDRVIILKAGDATVCLMWKTRLLTDRQVTYLCGWMRERERDDITTQGSQSRNQSCSRLKLLIILNHLTSITWLWCQSYLEGHSSAFMWTDATVRWQTL